MSRRKTFPVLVASGALVAASMADPVYTDAVGFVKLGNPVGGGTPAVAAGTDAYISLPLERPVLFSGRIDSVSGDVITVKGVPNWSDDLWIPSSGQPHMAIVTSGAEDGLRALITDSTSDTVTLSVTGPGNLSNVSEDDEIVIREFWTLKSFSDNAPIPDGSQVLLWDETLEGINQVSSSGYFFGGGLWVDDQQFQPANNVILYPGETFVLRTPPSTPIPALSLFGEVSNSDLRNELTKDTVGGPEDLFISLMGPIPSLLTDLNIPVADGDVLLEYDPTQSSGINRPPTASYFYGGGVWVDDQVFQPVPDLKLNPGVGYILRRSSSAPQSQEWKEPQPGVEEES